MSDPAPVSDEQLLQEVWMRVASRAPGDFDHLAQTARAFVGQFASAAINKVRADYCPPGRRTRDRSAGEDVVSLAEMCLLEDDRALAAFEAAVARIDVQRFLAAAESKVRQGLESVIVEGLTTSAAARTAGLARETFRRKTIELRNLLMQ